MFRVKFKQKTIAWFGEYSQAHILVHNQVVYYVESEPQLVREITLFSFGFEDSCSPMKI